MPHVLLSEEELNDGRSNTLALPYQEIDQYPDAAAWIDGNWKLHYKDDSFSALYNLTDDPKEEHNVVEQYQERAECMHKALRKWQDSFISSIYGKDY